MYTPSRRVDLPQSYMEPILVKYASHNGFAVRFSTELESVEKDAATGQWLAKVADRVRGDKYTSMPSISFRCSLQITITDKADLAL